MAAPNPMNKNAVPESADGNSKMKPTGAGQHAPLCRALPRGMTATNSQLSQQQHRADHPLLFASASLQPSAAPLTNVPLPACQRNSLPPAGHPRRATPSATASGANSHASLADSCYSSCSEGDAQHHSLLSRETSDSSNTGIATRLLAEELNRGLLLTTSSNDDDDNNGTLDQMDPGMVEFATRLGYSERSLRMVLRKLQDNDGTTGHKTHQQDRVLGELIKLDRQQRHSASPPPAANKPSGNSPRHSAEPGKQYQKQQQQQQQQPRLRPIVIDGSNIAMTHGNNTGLFSCRGIRDCVQFFARRGHPDILVFVPQFRREQPRPDAPIADQHILAELEAERRLVWTPSRRVAGRRIVCHDDRYILRTAAEKGAVVVSNDEYRELVKECPAWRAVVEQRLLMYSFVDGHFMPPDDPLGRRGPSLDQFLTFACPNNPNAQPMSAQPCPYAKKCTYGNKCKFFHPERPNGVRVSVTDRLVGTGSKQLLTARPSMVAEGQQRQHNHPQLGHSRSLNLPYGGNQVVDPWQLYNLPQSLFAAPPVVGDHSQPLSAVTSNHSPYYSPSSAVWGDCEFSFFGGGGVSSSVAANRPSATEGESEQQRRQRLQYHLSQLFPAPAVLAVMAAHPRETDAQRLCQRVIAFQKGFSDKDEKGEQ